ncbi:cupin domain-containing protein [Xenorhabdus sp. XENO-1]|uniref:cupin domain-containing protein n=1 Tax=Xenorhabdus bovienii TaxID=40576 RepID=UPI0020CA5A56|nr:cupin domain-containing protein [Xenorhabdus bovienii]MCP9268709.1 cupin domain-containing protein [Xenorhabdus bovienii subsp. africana]
MIKPLLLDQALPELMPIGSVTHLGSIVLEGDPQASGAMTHGEPTDNLTCGIFACTRGKFKMIYPFDEMATVHEGSVKLTDVKTGATVEYHKGDSWFAAKGTEIVWEITTERFVKHYMACMNA